MKRRAGFARRLAAVALLATLSACASPNPDLYTIAPVTGPTENQAPNVVLLREVVLPRYLERLQIVRSSEDYRLSVSGNDWWGEPLSAMLSRVLAQELGQRLPRSLVYGSSSPLSLTPDATIDVGVQRLDEDASGSVVLQAQASIAFKARRAPVTRSFRFTATPNGPGTAGEVAAISAAVGRLADGLAAMLAAGQAGP